MRTYRYRPLVVAAFALLAVGVALEDPAVTVSSVVPLTYLVYAEVTDSGDVEVDVSRRVRDVSHRPGSEFTVELRLRNTGDSAAADLRAVDDVPDGLHVVDGEPGLSGSLAPGEEMETRYSLRLRRGEHGFDAVRLRSRGYSGSREVEVDAEEPSKVVCRYPLDRAPEPRDTLLAGAVTSDEAGEGVEFHSVRDYRAGDPLSRVDWRRLAKHGSLSTVEFHEERSTDAVVVLDARQPCFQAPTEEHPDAVEYGVYAVERLYAAVRSTGGTPMVSVYSLASSLPPTDELPPSDVSRVLEERTGELRRDADTWTGGSADAATLEYVRAVDEAAHDRMEVYVVSPLLDEAAVETARGFAGLDRSVTVVSPDVTFDDDVGSYVERFRRRRRIRGLEGTASVVDWDVRRSLDEAVLEGGG